MSHALVIGHDTHASLRRLAPWFAEYGLGGSIVFGANGLPRSLDGYDALIVLGGAPLPDDDKHYPWLPATRKLIGEALARHMPMLGICLGGQLLAYTAGGRVERRKFQPEHGMTDIEATQAAASDPLFPVMPRHYIMAENHIDHITALPDNAVLLAHSKRTAVQAFRIGPCAWGLQFHPEIAQADIERWDAQQKADIEDDGFDWNQVMAYGRREDRDNTAAARRLACSFAAICTHRGEETGR